MCAEQPGARPAEEVLERRPSLDDRFDPAVQIVDYDPGWAALAAAELRLIGEALGPVAVRVEHVGSTAVPGLAAKPILDLQLSVDAIQPRERYVEPLERLGYLFVPAPESPDHHFFAKPPARSRTHHLHVCAAGSEQEFRHVAVRDFLHAHADEAARYAALKRRVLACHPAGPARLHRRQGRLRERARRACADVGSQSRLSPRPRVRTDAVPHARGVQEDAVQRGVAPGSVRVTGRNLTQHPLQGPQRMPRSPPCDDAGAGPGAVGALGCPA